MAKSLEELHRERGQLLERIVHQRSALALAWAPVQEAEQLGARAVALLQTMGQSIRNYPVPLGVAVVALLVWRPKGALRWARCGFWLWRRRGMFRSLTGAFLEPASQRPSDS